MHFSEPTPIIEWHMTIETDIEMIEIEIEIRDRVIDSVSLEKLIHPHRHFLTLTSSSNCPLKVFLSKSKPPPRCWFEGPFLCPTLLYVSAPPDAKQFLFKTLYFFGSQVPSCTCLWYCLRLFHGFSPFTCLVSASVLVSYQCRPDNSFLTLPPTTQVDICPLKWFLGRQCGQPNNPDMGWGTCVLKGNSPWLSQVSACSWNTEWMNL